MKNKKAFTLVELIVVITILSILTTIGFVSYSSLLGGSRDVNRISQVKKISEALEVFRIDKFLPLPDKKIEITSNWTIIGYQWDLWKNILNSIGYTESWLDPKYKEYFSYYITKNKKYFQILTLLEEPNKDKIAIFEKVIATDYSDKYPFVKWKKLWILTDVLNNPVQKLPIAITSLDLNDVGTDIYKAIISNDEIIVWSWTELAITNTKASCNRIKQIKWWSNDWIYKVDPDADWVYDEVECEMTTEGGGWELLWVEWDSLNLSKSWSIIYINNLKEFDIKEKNWDFDCNDSSFKAIWWQNKKCYVKY